MKIDADVISFEESTGTATADGNVRLTDGEFRITAPHLEYDNNTQDMTAYSSPEQKVVVFTDGRRIEGSRLDYNLAARRGKMSRPAGVADVYYVKGDVIDVAPSSEIRRRRASPDKKPDDGKLAAVWRGAVFTTCSEPHPHYRLVAKKATIYPGSKMTLHRPKAYLGKIIVLFSPFDLTIALGERHAERNLFPSLSYDQNKGVGLSVRRALEWNNGDMRMDFAGWSKGIFEMDALATHRLSPNLSLYARLSRAYDDDLEETDWRPRWGARYSSKGWSASAGWTRKELLSVEKRAGSVSSYVLDRDPEISVSSPWFRKPVPHGRLRVFGVWGNYRDVRWGNSRSYSRSGLGAQAAGELWAKKNFTPFYSASYTHYAYDDDIYDVQRVMDARAGWRLRTGGFDFRTTYLRQWVWGRSPLSWDAFGAREELYQEIGMAIPLRSQDYRLNVSARAAYDIISSEMAEMLYRVTYNHHCLLWEFIYKDDLRGDDDWMGLSLSIKNLPNGKFSLYSDMLSDPFLQ